MSYQDQLTRFVDSSMPEGFYPFPWIDFHVLLKAGTTVTTTADT
jgi:hypothetical protein